MNSTNNLENFCRTINYHFNNIKLLEEAITHPSLSNKNNCKNYQRLEFLGDKILAMVVASFLIKQYPQEKEGDLSKRQAVLVSGTEIAKIAQNIGLDKIIRISKG